MKYILLITVLLYSCSNKIISRDNDYKNTPLEEVINYANKNDTLAIKSIFKKNPDLINYPNNINDTIQPIIFWAIKERNIDFLKFLIKNNANVNVLDYNRYSPLLYYLQYPDNEMNFKIIKLLVDNGADVNYIREAIDDGKDFNNSSFFALQFLTRSKGNLHIIKYLVENGANVNIESHSYVWDNRKLYYNPVIAAMSFPEYLEYYIIDKKASIDFNYGKNLQGKDYTFCFYLNNELNTLNDESKKKYEKIIDYAKNQGHNCLEK